MKRPPYSVGIDLHKSVVQVCVLNAEGEVHAERRFRGDSLDSAF